MTVTTPMDQPDRPAKMPWRRAEIQLLGTVMLINIVDGLDNQLLPLSIGTISAEWGLEPAQFSGAVSAGFLGAALGTPVGGWLGDRWGRKPAILCGVVLFGLMTLAMAWCGTTGQLAAARLLAGIGLGTCLPPMLALVIEAVAPDKRGSAVALTMFSMPLGLTLSGIVIPRLNEAIGWKASIMCCAGAVFMVAALALVTLREAPRLARATTAPRADRSLSNKMAGLLAGLEVSVVLALMGSICLVYIAMSAALSWLPAFSLSQGISPIAAGQAISVWSLSGMAGTLVAGWVVNTLGGARAARVVVGCFAGATLLSAVALAATGASATSFYASASLAGLFASGAITVLYAAAAEQFPQHVRANGMAAVTLAGKAGGIAGGGSGLIMLALPSLAAFFATLGAIALAAWACVQGGRRHKNQPAERPMPSPTLPRL